jgi:hypothetical protein
MVEVQVIPPKKVLTTSMVYDIILCRNPIETCEFISLSSLYRNRTLPLANVLVIFLSFIRELISMPAPCVHLQTSLSLFFFQILVFFCSEPGSWCKLPSFENILHKLLFSASQKARP